MNGSSTAWAKNRWQALVVCGFLLLAIGLVFGQTVQYDFVNFDDDDYVYENPSVAGGLTAQGIAWAFTHSHSNNWHPLSWLSHMLDCQLYGLHAGGHHLTNVLLHAATAILLFLVLWRMTEDLWPSALVAAVFAVHPLRVESVAWITERKDVLSGLFFVLTLGAYVGYVRHRFSIVRYLTVVVLFALGLMAKPMLVTLPFVLLLLDYWPLGRMSSARWGGSCTATPGATVQLSPQQGPTSVQRQTTHGVCLLLWEKVPLLLLTAGSCVVTPLAQHKAVAPLDLLPLFPRVSNALVSYAAYLGQLFYPTGLAVIYPIVRDGPPIWKAAVALLVLTGISAAALACRRRTPYLLIGWLWYLGMLVPVIGLVQVGSNAMADRYTYLPQIGLSIALAWGTMYVVRSWPYRRWVCGVASALALAILMGCAWRQTTYWRNGEALWTRTLACTSQNYMAHHNFGNFLAYRGRIDEALAQYGKVLEVDPDNVAVHHNFGIVLAAQGRRDEAVVHYRKALEIKPDYAEVQNDLGVILAERGQLDEAAVHFQQALKVRPNYADAHNNLGVVLANRGRFDEAMVHCRKALEIRPGYAEARKNLDFASAAHGRLEEIIKRYRRALQIEPDDVEALNDLAWLRATCPEEPLRNGAEAVELAQRAERLSGGRQPQVLDTLAAAYAEAGRFPEALAAAREALELAERQNNQALADALRGRIALYESAKPLRQMPPAFASPRPKP